jgi:hypothetical protein
MLRRSLLAAALGLALVAGPLATGQLALADDDNTPQSPGAPEDAELDSPEVNGVIYGIAQAEGAQVLTVYSRDVTKAGLGVKIYVREPGLVARVKSGEICVGRYIIAYGVRTSVGSMDAEGIWVDPSTKCGTPPDAAR